MDAAYVFRIRFRLDPEDVWVEPNEFETVLRIPAVEPGEPGWLFFQHQLWRGEVGDQQHMRSVAEDHLGVAVSTASFSELETDNSYLDALKAAIGAELETFNADSVEEVLHKHLGSSIHVR